MTTSPSAPSPTPKSPSPTSITLAPYSLRYHPYRKPGDRPFKDPDGLDLFDVIHDCLQELAAKHRDHPEEQEVIKVSRLEVNRRQRWLEGWLEVGAYGWEAKLRRVKDFKERFDREAEDAEVLPFYFLLHLPRRDTHGVLILERFGPRGVKTALERELVQCLQSHKLTLDLDPLVPHAYVDHLKDAERVRKVRLIQTRLPSDIAEVFQLGGVQDVTSELVIRIGNDVKLIPKMLERIVHRGRKARGYAAVEQAFPHDRMKVEVEVEGRTRTLDVAGPGRITAYHDVSDTVAREGTHPTWKGIRCEAFRLLREIHSSTYALQGEWIRPSGDPPPLPDVCAEVATAARTSEDEGERRRTA